MRFPCIWVETQKTGWNSATEAVISELLKKSDLLKAVSDRAVLEDIDFIKKGNITHSGYRETLYRIAVMREGF